MGFMSIEDKEYWVHWEEREEGIRTKDALINAIMGLNDTQVISRALSLPPSPAQVIRRSVCSGNMLQSAGNQKPTLTTVTNF